MIVNIKMNVWDEVGWTRICTMEVMMRLIHSVTSKIRNSMNNSTLKKIKESNNPFFIRDILTIYLRKELFLKNIFQNIQILWVRQENAANIDKVYESLKSRPDIFFDTVAKDIYYKKRSVGCTLCTLWTGCTVVLSYKCHRDCFFCYEETPLNPKVIIDPYDKKDMDIIYTMIDNSFSNPNNKTLAITGGEPFLFPDKVFEILDYVRKTYPGKNTRVYTTGELLNEEKLKQLQALWLDEIRYSIKPWEEPNIALYRLTKKYIKSVLIEMPVQPNSREYMVDILSQIDAAQCIDGINLNELTFNNLNVSKYRSLGLMLDLPDSEMTIYHRYYDITKVEIGVYWSKLLALNLIDYFSSRKASFFMHYCDLDTVSRHHYIHKMNEAQKLRIPYGKITPFGLHKILRVYWNIQKIENIRGKTNIIDYTLNDKYLETNVQYANVFISEGLSPVIVYKNYDYRYDVDFELVTE